MRIAQISSPHESTPPEKYGGIERIVSLLTEGLVARGHEAFRELLHDMHEGRMRRLVRAGFTQEQAKTLSDLHTPNFM